jgi:hypothetical protein
MATSASPASNGTKSSVRATHTLSFSHSSAVLYRPDTTPTTASSRSRIAGAPLIPSMIRLAVRHPSGTASSRVVPAAHSPAATRYRYLRPGSSTTTCPVTRTSVRNSTPSVATSGPATASSGSSATRTARSCTGSSRRTRAPNPSPPASGSTRTGASTSAAPTSPSTCQAVTSTPGAT